MPNTQEGIETPGAGEAVNTAAGFEAAMAAKGIEREQGEGSAVDTDIASGLTYEGQPRDEAGRFAPKPVTPAEQEELQESLDPLEEFIQTQHGGDREAALAALHQEATNQRSVIGRQGNELGDVRAMREQMAELRGQIQALTQMRTATPDVPMTGDEVMERAGGMIESSGYSEAATQAANIAHETGDDRLYSAVIEAWNLEEPYQALTHVADFRAWQRAQEVTQAAPAPDQWVEDQKAVAGLVGPLERLSKEVGEERWAIIGPRMEKALEAMPQGVAELVVNADPEVSYTGLSLVADRAYLLGLAEEKTESERTARKMSGARVATSALRPPVVPSQQGGIPTPDEVEAAKQRFRQAILEEETTDVRSGLTFGQAAQPAS